MDDTQVINQALASMMKKRVWQDGKFIEIDEPHDLANRVLRTMQYYAQQAEVANAMAKRTKDEVLAEIKNEYDEENSMLNKRLKYAIAFVNSDKELSAYNKFFNEHRVCRTLSRVNCGKNPEIIQTGTGVGMCTTLRCPICGKEEDITDIEVW